MLSLSFSCVTSNFVRRLISALVLVPLVLAAVWAGGFVYDAFIVTVILIGFSEWVKLTNPKVRRRVRLMGFAGLAAVLFSFKALGGDFAFILSLVIWLAILLAAARKCGPDKEAHLSRALWLSFGIPYLAWSGLSLIFLRTDALGGLQTMIYLLFVVWGTDTGAYFAGRTIGGPKLWPQISPKKTWAGLFGGMALAAIIGYLAVCLVGREAFWFPPALAVILAVVSQAGDFFESFVKRRNHVKDSGTLIPGHGGVLDRADGLFFAAIFMLLFYMTGM